MQSLNKVARVLVQGNVKNSPLTMAVSSRTMTVVSGPPKNPISFAERLAHGLLISVGCCAVPAYILVNLKNYRAGAGES